MNRLIVAVMIATALVFGGMFADPAAAEPTYGGYGYHPMMGWGGWFMGPVMMLLFIAVLAGAVLFVARALGWHAGSSERDDRSLAILRERFARGEIDQAEFVARRKALD